MFRFCLVGFGRWGNVYFETIKSIWKIRKKYLLGNKKKVLTPTGYLTIEASNHLQQPVYILEIDSTKRFDTIYKTPVEIHPNPWFNKFSKQHYECNNDFHFLGNKYLTSRLF